jgi:hypothetical protein
VQSHIHGTKQDYAMESEAKPRTHKTHARGAKQALTTQVKGWARPRIEVQPEARVATGHNIDLTSGAQSIEQMRIHELSIVYAPTIPAKRG